MKKLTKILLLICLVLFSNDAFALEGRIEFNTVNIDYSILREGEYLRKGNEYLLKAEKASKTQIEKKNNYREALGYYNTVIKINPESYNTYGKIGYIYGKENKYTLARSFFNQGINMNPKNSFTHFMFAGYFFDNKDFNKAIKHYKLAYKYNYADKYSLYYNIGETNEKLGDLVKASQFYKKAYALKPSKPLLAKIQSIDAMRYDKSPYYYRKKPYFNYND